MLGIEVDSRKVKTAEKDLAGLATQSAKTEKAVNKLGDESSTATSKMAAGFKSASGSLSDFKKAILALGIGYLVADIFKANVTLERMTNSLKAATGSSGGAASGLKFVRLEADRLGLNLASAGDGFAQLAASSIGTSISMSQVEDIFSAVAEASTVLGLSADDTHGAIRALSQVMSKGKVQAEELRGQLGERIPGAFQIAARAMGKTSAELNKMLELGQLMSDDLLPKFAIEMRKTFSAALPDAINSANASLNRFKTAMFNLKIEIGNAGFMGQAVDALKTFTDALTKEETIAAITRLTEAIVLGFESGFKSVKNFGNALLLLDAYSKDQISLFDFITANPQDAENILKTISKIDTNLFEMQRKLKELNKNPLANQNQIKQQLQEIEDYTTKIKNISSEIVSNEKTSVITSVINKQSETVKKLTESLKFENSQIGLNSAQQRINLELRKANVSATSIEGQAIASLVTQIETKTAALKASEDEDERIRKAAADAREAFDKAAEDETTRRFNLFKTQMKEKADALAELDEMLSKPSVESSASLSFGDSYTDGISQAVTAMDRLNSTYEKERELLTENAAIKAAILEQTLAGSDEQEKRLLALTSKENAENEIVFKNQLSGYRELFATTSNLFDEQSKERKKLHQIEQAFAAIEIALNLKKALSAAVTAIATQGSGDPYTAFARVAAMIGLMGSVLAMAGGSLGSGSSSSSSSSAASVGTVSGDSTASSESVTKGYELLQDIHATEYKELRGIHDEMKDLNDNITGLVSNIVRNFGSFDDTMGVWTGEEQNSLAANFEKNYTTGMGIGGFEQTLLPIEKMFSQLTMKAVSWAISGILGGDSKTTMTGSGISLGSTNVGDILNGMSADVQAYADFKTKIDGGWFGSDKTKYNVTYQSVDESITRLFTSLYSNIGKTALEVNESLGASLANEINAYTFDIGKIDLKGKTGDEITEIISTKISEISDTMFESIFGEIVGQYQQINEGVFETAIRLVAEKEVIVAALERSSISITGDVIAITQSISTLAGGIEEFQDIFETYTDAFYTDAEKQAYLQESLSGVFTDLNLILPTTRDGYRAIVESLNMSNESDQERYVTLLQLSEAADEYYTALEDGFDSLVSNIETYVSELTSLSNSVKTALSALFGTTLNVDAARASSKNVLSQAIDAFRTTGTVDNVSEIQTALGVVSSLSADSFSSFEDYQREFFKSVGLISTLGTLTDNQLSIEERMLEAIEEQTDTEETQHTEAMARLDAIRAAVLGETVSVPGFASGGRHAGGWRMVGENGPELEYTGPSQIVENSTSASLLDNRELIEEVKRLRQDLASSQFAIAKNGKDMVKIIYRWDVNGLPEERAV
jgi:tape measure domain-containing protein